MYFYKAYGLKISSEIELPELSDHESAGDPIDLEIRLGKIETPKLNKTMIHRRGIRASFAKGADDHLFLFWKDVASFEAIGGNVLRIHALTEDPGLLSLFTVSEALGLILYQRGFFLLHASAVQIGDEAWCFMGSPGAGKSTTAAAFLKAGCRLLSDDLTAISFDERGKAYIIPAYPQVKIWDNAVNGLNYEKTTLTPVSEGINKFSFQPKDNFSHKPVPLGQIFFMYKAMNRPKLRELTASDIPIKMLRNFPLPLRLLTDDSLKKHFLQSFQCSKFTKIWGKRRPDGFVNLQRWVDESLILNTADSHA